MEQSMITLKALGILLAYPDEDLLEALPEIITQIENEKLLSKADKQVLKELIIELQETDMLESQERYVELFDRGRATSLHLFEHVHGESRDRGQAMVDLNRMYAAAGLCLNGNELPDYLPVVLEYLSMRPLEETRDMLGDCAHILRALGEHLRDRGSHYSAVPAALLTIAGEEGLGAGKKSVVEDTQNLDEEWVDEPVIFGPSAGQGCGGKSDTSVVRFVPKVSRGDSL
jgi:nitrate reductase molybdenum cofactor assembly chaperone NarJ/NarW